MDIKEMRELPLAELQSEAGKLEARIWKMRFQAKGEPMDNSGNYGELKKERARLLTILRETELGVDGTPARSTETAPASAQPADETEEAERASLADAGGEESAEATEEPGEG